MPNINGSIGGSYNYVFNSGVGALKTLSVKNTNNVAISGTGNINNGMELDASLSNSIYGNSNTVTPSSLITNFYIKY